MTNLVLTLTLFALTQTGDKETPRQPNPLAPSLPVLTKEEAERYEAVINRFIKFDIGKLTGGEGKKALDNFNRLPAEAIFELIEGFNRAAAMEHSCPAVIIGRKILKIINGSQDMDLLLFAKENVGAGVSAKRHQGMIREVQFGILLRKGELQRRGIVAGAKNLPATVGETPLASLPLSTLVKKAEKENGLQLKLLLTEIERRQGAAVFETLAIAVANQDDDIQKLGVALIAKHMTRQTSAQLKALLKNERAEVRAAAVTEIGVRRIRQVSEVIELLNDSDAAVRQAAHRALMQISGVDHGPADGASFGDRADAQRRWRSWWESQNKR